MNELAELLEGEQKGRSEEVTKLKDDLKALQEALDASRAAFKEYQEAEPGRVAALRQNYIHSVDFVEKVCDRLVIAFELAITATADYLKTKGQLPELVVIPATEHAALLTTIPKHIFDYLE